MKISSDGEIFLAMSHKTENYICFTGERHGKKFKVYLSEYDLRIIGTNLHRTNRTGSDLRAIVDVTDDTERPRSNFEAQRMNAQLERDKIDRQQQHFRNEQLNLLSGINDKLFALVEQTAPKPKRKCASKRT